MDMIERVARAIYDATGIVAGELPSDWDDFGPEYDAAREDWKQIARAAIEAMRDPTDEMIKSVGEYRPYIWKTMIDAAIRSKNDEKD